MKNPVKFGKYYLLERVNVGGMAEVFKAKAFGEAGFERLVAVKRVLPSIAEDQEFIAMFIDEAKLAVQLTHPNVAQIFELGKVGEAYFIALEYVAGKDLRAIFDRARKRGERLPIPLACYVVMKICEGLDYAHNKKDAAGRNLELVHRDVSPQNMLISYEGDVKLIDFGIAKAASKSSKTQAGILKGKFGYMSPEQVRGLQIDRRSDLFSVGICLYELLTMERLFVGESDFSTLEKVRNVEIMPPSTYNRTVPEELEQIVLKALAKHPEDRYRTAMDLHDDLQSFMYTSGNFFARKDLSTYMHRIFQDEIAKEASKDDEYRRFDSRKASDLDVFDTAMQPQHSHSPHQAAPAARNNAPPPPPPAHARASVPPPPPVQARVSVPPPPPPPPTQRSAKSTMMGGFAPQAGPSAPGRASQSSAGSAAPAMAAPATALARPAPAPAPAAAAPAMDMEWDDEELATQVYDRPEGMPLPGIGSPMPSKSRPSAPANGHPVANGASGMVARQPAPSVPPGAQHAGPRAQTMPLHAVSGSPSLPTIPSTMPQAAVRAPVPATMGMPQSNGFSSPFPGAPAPHNGFAPMGQQGPAASAPMPATMGMPQMAANAPYAPMGNGASMGQMGAPNASMTRPDAQQNTVVTAAQQQKKSNRNVAVFGVLGVIAVASIVAVGMKLMGGPAADPTGTLAISTNVPGVQLLIDGQPQIGNGMSFTIPNLRSNTGHVVVAQRQGYRPVQQVIQVRPNEITPMQIAMDPDIAQMQPQMPPQMPPQVAQQAPAPMQANVAAIPGVAPAPQPTAPVAVAQAPVAPQAALPPQPGVLPAQPAPQPVAAPPVAAPPQPATVVAVSAPPRGNPRRQNRTVSNSNSNSSPTPRPTPTPSGGGAAGFLSISTRPASRCSVAGQTFSTPRIRLELPAGTYRVTCSNSDFNVSGNFTVTIRSGQVTAMPNQALN